MTAKKEMRQAAEADVDALQAGLTRFLSEQWDDAVTVQSLQLSSAGARRLNVLFDAVRGDVHQSLVLTAIPNANIMIQPIVDEAETIRCAHRAGLDVPDVLFVSENTDYVGGPFFISTRMDGETVPRKVLRLVAAQGHGAAIAERLGQNFARLHAINAAHMPTHIQWRESVGPAEFSLLALEEQIKLQLQPAPVFNLAMRWLEDHLPSVGVGKALPICLIHADMRSGNLVISEDGLVAILDWEGSRAGDPMTDLAWPCLRTWRFGADAQEVGGFAERSALIRGYEAAGGTFDAQRFHWWKVCSTLRWGLGLAGQARTHLDGSMPNIVMAASGRRVAELEYDLLGLIKP